MGVVAKEMHGAGLRGFCARGGLLEGSGDAYTLSVPNGRPSNSAFGHMLLGKVGLQAQLCKQLLLKPTPFGVLY